MLARGVGRQGAWVEPKQAQAEARAEVAAVRVVAHLADSRETRT
jgi:hypothetical protein